MTDDARPPVEIGDLIDARPLTRLQIQVAVLCGLVVFFDGYDVQVMALAVPSVSETWGAAASSFGVALSASLLGIGLGSGLIGPFGDRIGRRPVIVGGLLLAGLATLATTLSHTLLDFTVWRLLTGLGIGASIVNAAAHTSEYMPARRRAWLVTVMYCNVALGAFFAGLWAPTVLRVSDWRGLFLLGGAGTLAVCALAWALLPESLKFLVARRPGDPRIGGLLARLAPEVEPGSVFAAPRTAKKRSLMDLVNADYRARTAVLWTLYALNIFVIYVLVSWLPTLLRRAGWPTDEALIGSVLFQLGGVAGGLVLSSFIDRGRMRGALIVGYATCAVALAAIAFTPSTFLIWGALMLAVGAGISGAQFVLIALAAEFYPLTIRATGVGWAVTVGRVGAVAAPLVGGAVLPLVTPVHGLTLLMVPALACAACAVLVRREWRDG